MRTSLRVFTAAVSTLLLGALVTVLPFATPAGAVNGIHTINISSRNCAEGANPCNVDVTLQGGVNFGTTITADITSSDGSARAGQDYTAVNQHVSWASGESGTKTVQVNTTGDSVKEPNETFTLSVTNPVQAAAGTQGTITIPNDDGTPVPTLNIVPQPGTADEGNADNMRRVDVSVSNPTTIGMDVNYATSDGSATSDTAKGAKDYTPVAGTLHWDANDGSVQHIDIPIKGDTIPEPDETLLLNFGSPNNVAINGGNPANIVLHNDDAGAVPALTIDPIQDKTEGDTSQTTQTINVTLTPAAAQIVTVDYTTSDGTAKATAGETKGDYELTKGTLTFPQGTTSKSFTVPINGDTADEQDETYHVTLSNPINANLGDPATRDAKILNDDFGQITTVPGQGGGPHTRIWGASGADLGGFMAYDPSLTSGIHVSRGDFFKPVQNGWAVGADGVDEIVTSLGAYPSNSRTRTLPRVTIFATDGTNLASFLAYDSGFGGGVFTAAGNLDGDPTNGDELVTGPGAGGGPHVKVWRIKGLGDNAAVINGFYAYDPAFTGGVRVAVGNEIGDAKDEIVTAPGPGGGPHVRVFSPTADGSATGTPGFMAYDPSFTGGVNLAAVANRIVTAPGPGGGPHVRVFDGGGAAQGGGFMAYDPTFTGGVSVGLGNLDNDLEAEIVTGAGPGGGPHVKVFRQDGSMPFGTGFFAYDPNFHGGVEVAISVAGTP
ncbi:MAG: fibronectin-binding autotransporter adhesin [Actinomycetota bacterium]